MGTSVLKSLLTPLLFSAWLLLSETGLSQMGGASRTPFLSSVNSTTTPLASGATFTGEWEQCFHWATLSAAVATDLDGTLQVQFSPDAVNVDSTLTYKIDAGVTEPPHKLEIFRRYCRVIFTNNGATSQTYLRLQTIFGMRAFPTVPRNAQINLDQDAIVTRSMDFDFDLGTGQLHGLNMINKFGTNIAVSSGDVPEDLTDVGGVYPGFPMGAVATVADTVNVVSTSALDDEGSTGCEKGTISGLGNDGRILTETITLNGTTAVTSNAEFYRVNEFICTQSNNGTNTSFNAGVITVSHTSTPANVFTKTPIATNNARVCAYTIPANKHGFLRYVKVVVSRKNSATMRGSLWVREFGGVPRLVRNFSASDSDHHEDEIYGYLDLPPLTDVTVRVTEISANDVEVKCEMVFIIKNT